MNLLIIAAVATLASGAGGYFLGRGDGAASVKAAQLEEYRKSFAAAAKEAEDRAASDRAARVAAEGFINKVNKGLRQVREDFDGIPMVTVGGDGCRDLSDAFRMRWNSAESAAAGGGDIASIGPAVRGDGVLPP